MAREIEFLALLPPCVRLSPSQDEALVPPLCVRPSPSSSQDEALVPPAHASIDPVEIEGDPGVDGGALGQTVDAVGRDACQHVRPEVSALQRAAVITLGRNTRRY